MASFFPDFTSFSSWLASKTEAELKTRLYRANPVVRLDGSKSVLVRRLEEVTRHLTRERQLIIFPELRRRQSMLRAATANRPGRVLQGGQDSTSRLGAGQQERQFIGDSRLRTVQREVTSSSNRPSNTRPVPNFNPQLSSRRLTIPVSPLLGMRRSHNHPEVAMTPVRPRTINPPRNIFAGDDRTPEQILRETLELHAGRIIQSISQAVTPRIRQHSISSSGALSPVNSRRRAASTSSAEKRGPEVLMEEGHKVKLECKICFDSRINTVLLPCGHACSCQDCSVKLKFATWDSKCPICRSRIQNISMLYFS